MRLIVGKMVRHWFAGVGIVRRQIGHLLFVEWERRGSGWAYKKDCKPI